MGFEEGQSGNQWLWGLRKINLINRGSRVHTANKKIILRKSSPERSNAVNGYLAINSSTRKQLTNQKNVMWSHFSENISMAHDFQPHTSHKTVCSSLTHGTDKCTAVGGEAAQAFVLTRSGKRILCDFYILIYFYFCLLVLFYFSLKQSLGYQHGHQVQAPQQGTCDLHGTLLPTSYQSPHVPILQCVTPQHRQAVWCECALLLVLH